MEETPSPKARKLPCTVLTHMASLFVIPVVKELPKPTPGQDGEWRMNRLLGEYLDAVKWAGEVATVLFERRDGQNYPVAGSNQLPGISG